MKFSNDQRKAFSKNGLAMPDGSYPIRNTVDLKNAILSYGRANGKPDVKAWIMKRAKDLGAEKLLPTSWTSAAHSADELYHHGVKGMKWGVTKERASSLRGPRKATGSADYVHAVALKKKGSTNLSTAELRELTNRLQLEQQYSKLNPKSYEKGLQFVKSVTAAGTTIASLYALTKTPLGQDIVKALKSKTG